MISWIAGGRVAIVQACLYLATGTQIERRLLAQQALGEALRDRFADAAPASSTRPTQADEGYRLRQGYAYDHDADEGVSGSGLLAGGNEAQVFYQPTDRGLEAKVRERMLIGTRFGETFDTRLS